MRGQHPWWLCSCPWHVSSREYMQFLKMKTFVSIKGSRWKCWGLPLNREETAKPLWKASVSPLKLTLNDHLFSPGHRLVMPGPHLTHFSASARSITSHPGSVFHTVSLVHKSPLSGAKGAASNYLATLMPESFSGTWQVRVTGEEQEIGIPVFSSPNPTQYLISKAELFWLLLRSDYL